MVSQVPTPSSYEAQINALGQYLQTLRDTSTNPERVDATITYLQKEVEPDLIWIGLYDADGRNVEYLGGWIADADTSLLAKNMPVHHSDLLDQVFIHKKPIGVSDLSHEKGSPELFNLALKFAIQGCGLFPIRKGDECRGVIIVGWPHQNLSLPPERMSCFSIAFKDLGTRLDRTLATGQLLFYRGSESFVGILDKICLSTTLESAIETIALEIQTRLKPIETRIYWLETQNHKFLLGGSAAMTVPVKKGNVNTQISTTALGKVYPELQNGKSVTIIEGTPIAQIAEQITIPGSYQSVHLCPIIAPDRLLGFIALSLDRVDGLTDIAESYLKITANLLALSGSKLSSSNLLGQNYDPQRDMLQGCVELLCQVDQGIAGLKPFAFKLCQTLQAKHFSLIYFDSATQSFGVAYQLTAQRRQLLPSRLNPLNELDLEFLFQPESTFQIDHWAEDLRLLNWRSCFAEIGVQSLLSCRLRWANTLEGLLLIGYDTPRFWTRQEQQWLELVSAPLGYLVHQWRIRLQQEEQQRLNQSTLAAISRLQAVETVEAYNKTLIQGIVKVLSPTMVTLMTWRPGDTTGQLSVYPESLKTPIANGQNAILAQMPLFTELIHQEEPILCSRADLSAEMRSQLPLEQVEQLLAIAIRLSPTQAPFGVLWIGHSSTQEWTEEQLKALWGLVQSAANVRYRLLMQAHTSAQISQAKLLNWYKLQKLEQYTQELTIQTNWLEQQESTIYQGAEQSSTPLIFKRRYKALMQSLQGIGQGMTLLSGEGAWQLPSAQDTILLPTFLKAALERLEPSSRQHQLWTQVHGLPEDSLAAIQQISLQGDIEKFKLVLDDLLAGACERSVPQGRIDLWPRLLDPQWLEVSITDQGILDPALIQELSLGRFDPISPSRLNQSPGQQLWLCQQLMQRLGGDLGFYQLEDGRILSRLVYPVAIS